MKFLILLTCLAVTALAQDRRGRQQQQYPEDDQQQFQQPERQQDFQQPRQQDFQQTRPQQRVEGSDRHTTPIPIVRFDKEQGADGSYKTSYETGNNIIAEETGFLKNVGVENQEALVQHGSYSYTAPDGSLITVTYTADEQGFRAEGAHIPTPPPVPEEIQKSLDLIYAGIKAQQEEEARNPKLQKLDTESNLADENYPTPNRFRQ